MTFLASLVSGRMVSAGTGKYVFTDAASGKVVKELDADGDLKAINSGNALSDYINGGR